MGFFGKLKSIKNLVTGGGATVTLEVLEPTLAGAFQVRVQANVGEAALNVARVYLKVRGREEIELTDVPTAIEDSQGIRVEERHLHRSQETGRQEYEIDDIGTLEAGSENEWLFDVELSAGSLPTFDGELFRHGWSFYAGLDVRGNDPDSGWVGVEIAQGGEAVSSPGFDGAGHAVSGGRVNLEVEAVEPNLEGPFQLRVRAVVGSQDLEIQRVYLQIRSVEEVVVDNLPTLVEEGMEVYIEQEDLPVTINTHAEELEVDGSLQLQAHSEHEWAIDLTLPPGANPSYQGEAARHIWQVQACLVAIGNDACSRWTPMWVANR
ncbi:MAG: hypothetical protein HQL52_11485 [Magnetococcales bacterium]|nr:hypothetical protein [Magnetococcales bacterium]